MTRVEDPKIGIGNPTPEHELHIINLQGKNSRLTIIPGFVIEFSTKIPNAWRRFWFWALLGWRWEMVDDHKART